MINSVNNNNRLYCFKIYIYVYFHTQTWYTMQYININNYAGER